MTLEQLRIFVGVAEREHMTAAARTLNITQSAASAAIAALEERHDVKLFHRVGRGIALTETGHAFLPQAKGVLARAEAASTLLDEFGALARGTLAIAASQTIAAYWLPPILARFHAHYPGIDIALSIANTREAATIIHEGSADLGIVEGVVDDPAIASWQIGEDRLVLVGASVFDDPIDKDRLREASWIMREEGSGTRSTLDRHLHALGIDPADLGVALVLPSNESVRTAVEAGAGIAALSALVVAPSVAAGRLHVAPIIFGPRPFFGLRHRERYRTKAADTFLRFLSQQQ